MDAPVVDLKDVTTAYEGETTPTLHHVTLRFQAGERVAIAGPNGAGKTTLLEVVNGLLPVTGGSVRVFGHPVSSRTHRLRSGIAYMAQEMSFDAGTPFLVETVVSAALYGQLGWIRRPSRDDQRRVHAAIESVGMHSLRRRPIGRLSGGQQRKVLLARALAQNARLLLLDEPTANLDPEAKVEVARLVREIEDRLHATALIVSHEDGPLTTDAQRLIRLEQGRVVHDSMAHAHAMAGRES
jgi:zinc/manganese transport system ATP-binding protein